MSGEKEGDGESKGTPCGDRDIRFKHTRCNPLRPEAGKRRGSMVDTDFSPRKDCPATREDPLSFQTKLMFFLGWLWPMIKPGSETRA